MGVRARGNDLDRLAGRSTADLSDPRVETLVAWARDSNNAMSGTTAEGALEALADSLPGQASASALAYAAAAAYQRVPSKGPRDLQAGHRIVAILGQLGVAGGRELVRLRDGVKYQYARQRVMKTLSALQRELRIPAGELKDAFVGPQTTTDLAVEVPIGNYVAVVQVADDLQHVHTRWRNAAGKQLASRPRGVNDLRDALAIVDHERTRLRAHVRTIRERLEAAMTIGETWTTDDWVARMFGDPLRAAMSRRLIWRVDDGNRRSLVIPDGAGLQDLSGRPVELPRDATVALWHPAEDPDLQSRWTDRLASLGIRQPVQQASREVILADPHQRTVTMVSDEALDQTIFRGFLLRRGWQVPYLGPYFEVPEARREFAPAGPVAVAQLELDANEALHVNELAFESVTDEPLDARSLPPGIVSEAGRDILGAINAASSSE